MFLCGNILNHIVHIENNRYNYKTRNPAQWTGFLNMFFL